MRYTRGSQRARAEPRVMACRGSCRLKLRAVPDAVSLGPRFLSFMARPITLEPPPSPRDTCLIPARNTNSPHACATHQTRACAEHRLPRFHTQTTRLSPTSRDSLPDQPSSTDSDSAPRAPSPARPSGPVRRLSTHCTAAPPPPRPRRPRRRRRRRGRRPRGGRGAAGTGGVCGR